MSATLCTLSVRRIRISLVGRKLESYSSYGDFQDLLIHSNTIKPKNVLAVLMREIKAKNLALTFFICGFLSIRKKYRSAKSQYHHTYLLLHYLGLPVRFGFLLFLFLLLFGFILSTETDRPERPFLLDLSVTCSGLKYIETHAKVPRTVSDVNSKRTVAY